MSIYDEMKVISTELLGEFKHGTIKLIQIIPASGPDDNPGTPTENSYVLSAVTKDSVPFKYLRDGFATSSDFMVIAAIIDGVTPTKNDFIEIDGVRYKIIADMTVPGAGTRVVWKFIVRK